MDRIMVNENIKYNLKKIYMNYGAFENLGALGIVLVHLRLGPSLGATNKYWSVGFDGCFDFISEKYLCIMRKVNYILYDNFTSSLIFFKKIMNL